MAGLCLRAIPIGSKAPPRPVGVLTTSKGRDDLRGEDYEVSHGGYDTRFVQEDPDRLVPLDAMREMEKNGVIGKLHAEFISTCGRSNPLSNTRRLGREIAEKIKRDGIDAVILTST